MSEEYNQGERDYGGGEGADVKLDDFVGQIVQDPNQPPDLLLLSGYLGASSEEAHVRLYLDEELSRYVEIPNEAIRHSQPLSAEQSPLGGSLVWIDRGAEVLHGKAGAERSKATFLEGQIAQDFAAGAGGGQGAEAGGAVAQTQFAVCQSQFTPCIPQTEVGPNCKSQFGPCIPVTEWPGCRTLTGIFCTRFGPGCRKTLFDPFCTRFGPQCKPFTVQFPNCPSTQFADCPSAQICITQDLSCQVSGFVCQQPPGGFTPVDPTIVATVSEGHPRCSQLGCAPPFDPTIVQQQQFGGPIQAPTRFCPSRFEGCPPFSGVVRCPPSVIVFQCPTFLGPCRTHLDLCQTFAGICVTRVGCESRVVAGCQTQVGCFEEQFGGAPPQAAAAQLPPTRVRFACRTQLACPTQEEDCPTRFCTVSFRCPSEAFPCSETFLCPTVQGCPSIGTPCQTSFGQCETAGQCPSAVDACPTRFGCETQSGCFPTQICVTEICGASQACEPQFGGGGQPQAAAQAAPQTQFGCFPSQFVACQTRSFRCPSAVDACPTRFGCPSQLVACQSQLIRCQSVIDACPTRFGCGPSVNMPCVTRDLACQTVGRCPSAVDACPTRFGCFETQAGCFVSRQCGGGFDPGFGGGGF